MLCVLALTQGFAAPAAHAFNFFGLFGGEEEAGDTAPVPDPTPYQASLRAGGGDLEATLRDTSLLIVDQEKVPSGTVGLLSRARADQQRLIAALYQEGYYGGTVSILVNGTPFDQVAIDADLRAAPAKVEIVATPGPLFTFGTVTITGADAASPSPTDVGPSDLGLRQGETARSTLILEAERRLVADWKARGRPLAKVTNREIVANHATNTLAVTIDLAPGPEAVFGTLEVRGARDVDADFIARQSAIPVGARYDPARLREAERRLRDLQLFDSLAVSQADSLAGDGSIPIAITVSERKARLIGAGITASNTDGIGLETYWAHRNLFGQGERLRIEGSVSRIGDASGPDELDYHAAILFSKPGVFGPATTFNSKLAIDQEHPDAFRKRSVSGEVGLSREFSETLSGSIGTEVEFSNIRNAAGEDDFLLAGIPVEFVYDTRDSTLDPGSGIHATAFVEPLHDFKNARSFFVAKASVAGYWTLDEARRIVFASRLAAGSIWGADLTDIPADRRFYAGGGGSIRGYSFQAASPRAADNTLIGGRSFVEASFEARVKVTDTIGIVPFFDIGGAFTDTVPGSGDEFFSGAGIGLRYLTPVGPLRLDVAIPLKDIRNEPDFGIYVGLGQSF